MALRVLSNSWLEWCLSLNKLCVRAACAAVTIFYLALSAGCDLSSQPELSAWRSWSLRLSMMQIFAFHFVCASLPMSVTRVTVIHQYTNFWSSSRSRLPVCYGIKLPAGDVYLRPFDLWTGAEAVVRTIFLPILVLLRLSNTSQTVDVIDEQIVCGVCWGVRGVPEHFGALASLSLAKMLQGSMCDR